MAETRLGRGFLHATQDVLNSVQWSSYARMNGNVTLKKQEENVYKIQKVLSLFGLYPVFAGMAQLSDTQRATDVCCNSVQIVCW